MKYRKKPIVVDVYQYFGDGFVALEWSGSVTKNYNTHLYITTEGLFIATLEGNMKVSETDYIICGVAGEFYACRADIFEKTYEKVDDEELPF